MVEADLSFLETNGTDDAAGPIEDDEQQCVIQRLEKEIAVLNKTIRKVPINKIS